MKKKNAIAEFDAQKREFLLRNFRSAIAAQSVIDRNKAFRIAAEAPAPRFWVSETRAAEVMSRLLAEDRREAPSWRERSERSPRADTLRSMLSEKREMYREIYARFLALREKNKDASIAELTFEVVNASAPRSYISWQTVRSIIYAEMRRKRKERRDASCR